MRKFIMRLDDACEKMDVIKWDKMEVILDKYSIKPLVGVIPLCNDPMMNEYKRDDNFWIKARNWKDKGWEIALHGFDHVYLTEFGGINPVNMRSEFAGLTYEQQKAKILEGLKILSKENINPRVFFAPSHTFDDTTIEVLLKETEIRIISDTIAMKPYCIKGITFVPQQSGRVRNIPFMTTTFCYHPNTMNDDDFFELEQFLSNYSKCFISFPTYESDRKPNILDKILKQIYFARRKI